MPGRVIPYANNRRVRMNRANAAVRVAGMAWRNRASIMKGVDKASGWVAGKQARRRFDNAPVNRAPSPGVAYPKPRDGLGGKNQWTSLNKNTGKKISTKRYNDVMLKAGRESVVYGFRNVKSFDDNGAMVCFNQVAGGAYSQPLHVYDLTSIIRVNNVPNVGRYLYLQDEVDGTNMRWGTLSGLNFGGAASAALQAMTSSKTVSTIEGKAAMHEYVSLKMNLWGAKNKAVRWTIELLQVRDETYDPFSIPVDAAIPSKQQQCLEELLKQYTFNPISKIDRNVRKGFYVVKRFDCTIEANSNEDGDADPNVRTLKWFIRRNRLLRYDETSKAADGRTDLETPSDLKSTVQNDLYMSNPGSVRPRDKQRLFLMVRCTDFSPESAAFSNSIHGSYDIDWRSKFSYLD